MCVSQDEDLYEELPQTEAEEMYVDTESLPPPPPPGEPEELYDECMVSPPPPPLPPVIRPPPLPPLSPAPPPPPIPDFRRRSSESPPKKKKSTPIAPQSQGIDMSEILQKRRQLQKVASRTSDGMILTVDTNASGAVQSPPWQSKPLKSSIDQTEQGRKNKKPEWMKRTLKRVGDRPPSVAAESPDGGGDKGGALPFQIRLKKTGIALPKDGQPEEETGSAVSNEREVSSQNVLTKFPKPSPKPRPVARPTQQVESTAPTTPTRAPRNSFPAEVTKKPPPRPPTDDLSERPPAAMKPSQRASPPDPRSPLDPRSPPDPRSLPKPGQEMLPPKPDIQLSSPRLPKRNVPIKPPEPAEPPPPPLDDDDETPPIVTHLPKPGVSPPDVRSLPKPSQQSPAVPRSQPKPSDTVDAPPPRPSKDGMSISIGPPPPVLPDRSPHSEVAPRTKAESTSDAETSVPRYRRRPLPVVDLNKPPPKPYHSKPPSLPSLVPQLMRPRSDSQLESEVDSLLSGVPVVGSKCHFIDFLLWITDIDHNPKGQKPSEGYSADDIYDDVAPDQKQSQTQVSFSLEGVTTTAST